jgi:hypothetical protein
VLIVLTTVLISCAVLVVLAGLVTAVYLWTRTRKPVNEELVVQLEASDELGSHRDNEAL